MGQIRRYTARQSVSNHLTTDSGSRHVPQHETPTRRRGRQPKIRTLRFTETTWATADMESFRLAGSSNPSLALTVTLIVP